MSSRALALALLGACAADGPIEREVSGRATVLVALEPDRDRPEPSDVEYRWAVAAAPDDSHATEPSSSSSAAFLPDVRGRYVVDRWLRYGVGEDLTYRFLVLVAGQPPVAMISAPASVAVGQSVTVDGSASSSIEGRALSFAWRLTSRPRDSTAQLAASQLASTSFEADVAGVYEVELAVFDGELWSDPLTLWDISAQ